MGNSYHTDLMMILSRFITQTLAITTCCIALTACSSIPKGPPKNPENICAIFKEFPSWEQAAVLSQKRWGTPIATSMAIMFQESSYRHNAQPPYQFILWIIPIGRASSAYGYAQAQDPIWSTYEKEQRRSRDREDFSHAIDFIAWYVYKNHLRNGTSKWDTYHQYLAYHEGMGGFSRGTYRQKKWLLETAQRVQKRASRYSQQLKHCPPVA